MSDRNPQRWTDRAAPAEEVEQPGDDLSSAEEAGSWGRSGRRKRRRARRREEALASSLTPVAAHEQMPAIQGQGEVYEGDRISERDRRVAEIQAGLVRRRRWRAALLGLRLLVMVILPTAAVGWYYHAIASPMYETRTEFVIQKADAPTGGSGLGGLFSGFGLADAKDSIAVQGYLTSIAAMERLDAEHGFVARFQDPALDPLQRLSPDAGRTDAHALYRDRVIVGFDVTEGILRMSVIAPDRESSQAFASALIAYAEEMVDNLSARARERNMTDAAKSFEQREVDVRAAAARVLELQTQFDTFSAEGELQIDLSVIQAQELQLETLRRERNEILANPRPNEAQLAVIERSIAFTEASIARRRSALTEAGTGKDLSLAAISSQLQMAQSDLAAKEQMRIVALNTLEQARIEAARQVRYLSVAVPPVAPDRPTYPRALENTAVAFFAFLGLYIMISLTLAILREQVSV